MPSMLNIAVAINIGHLLRDTYIGLDDIGGKS